MQIDGISTPEEAAVPLIDTNPQDEPEEDVAINNEAEETQAPGDAVDEEANLTIDFPIATMKKLVKEAAGDARFSQDALAGLSRACGVFLLYASVAAQDVAVAKKKATLLPEHVLIALSEIGFPEIAEECKAALN